MNRTRVRASRLVGLAATVVTVALAAGTAAGSEQSARTSAPGIRRIVLPGDTVWEIARQRVGAEGDPRPLVEAIRRANGLGSRPVQAGQVLVVPPGY